MRKNYFKIFAMLLAFVTMSFTQANAAAYLVGEVDGNSWACDYGAELTAIDTDVYYGQYYVSGYFAIATELNSDWDTFNNNYRYGPATDGEAIVINGSNDITKVNSSFQIGTAGTYDIFVDMVNMTITVLEVDMLDLTITPGSGTVAIGTEVTISSTTSGASIYYTLDGSTPDATSTKYTAPFSLSEGIVTVKAIAISGESSSYVTTATYNVTNADAEAITIRFQKPTEWDSVNIWAWTDEGNVFSAWPGEAMTADGELWVTYTFDESIAKVSFLFANADGTAQTADVADVVVSTSYVYAGDNVLPTVYEDSSASVAAIASEVSVAVYPNPVVDVVKVKSTEDVKSIVVLDVTGKVVAAAAAAQVDMSKLPAGLYLVKINGTKIVKVIKK